MMMVMLMKLNYHSPDGAQEDRLSTWRLVLQAGDYNVMRERQLDLRNRESGRGEGFHSLGPGYGN